MILHITPGTCLEVDSWPGIVDSQLCVQAAMFGMLAAFGAELATHEPVFVQIQKAPLAIFTAFVTIIAASAIPVFRGADLQQNGAGCAFLLTYSLQS